MHFKLPKNIDFVLNTLQKSGFEAYIVGGCVRDLLCGKTPHDYDITTSALPNQTQRLFPKSIDTGIKHGTVTVIIDGTPIEVTTFRTEGAYLDHRRPERVEFVKNVSEDLSRRDFTVNAMCYNHENGLVDLFGGQEDIAKKTLRAVGEPHLRFREDALRILRLVRFAATLGFTPETATLSAAKECKCGLCAVSAERILCELQKAALGNNIKPLNEIISCGALAHLGIVNHINNTFKDIPPLANLRLFAMLDMASNDLTKTLKGLKCSNKFFNYCMLLKEITPPCTRYAIKQILNRADYAILCDYAHLHNCADEIIPIANQIIENGEPYKLSHLAINGKDIMKLGFSGEEIGQKLNLLLDLVMQDPKLNTRKKLTELI